MQFKHLKKTILAALTIMIALSTVLAGCGAKQDNSVQSIKKKGELVVGTSADFAPYEFPIVKNGKQKIVGYDILLAHEIAKSLGVKKVKIVNTSFSSLISELQNKKVDIVMAGMAYTKQRAKVVAFSKVYHTGGQVLLVAAKNKDKYANIAALKGTTLGAQQSSEQETIGKKLKGVKLVTESSNNTLFQELSNGTLDGVITGDDTAEAYAKEHPDKYAVASNIKFKYDAKAAGTRIVARKQDKALMKKINQVITKDQKNGTLNKLYKKAQDIQVANNK
ncbi:transporter substrate-binding domain-containing protein [Limosilactobacillus caecicola]|uniref:transporter substrate-binding domain-containing protein n=1 Tax=Limosilactobacillus caecicola TaxID=2941332 RepID=UPI00203E3E59|nr:transporter substrate-binding domain-containing protein [Limosilactobacillus caecicola]